MAEALLQPMPMGRDRNQSLHDQVIELQHACFLDPSQTLQSVMRALYVIKQVLKEDGYVYVVNSNPLLQPLLREAALCCSNANVWFLTEPWTPGCPSRAPGGNKLAQMEAEAAMAAAASKCRQGWTPGCLSRAPGGNKLAQMEAEAAMAAAASKCRQGGTSSRGLSPEAIAFQNAPNALFKAHHQPTRQLLRGRGHYPVNVHCPEPDVLSKQKPSLGTLDKWRLLNQSRGDQAKEILREVVAAETDSARLPIPMSLQGKHSKLRLIIALDLTHDYEAIQEAFERHVMTVSVVNAHSDLSRITYPVYAGEFHVKFQHFFLDWIVKVANVP
eukprot:gene11284-18916_t